MVPPRSKISVKVEELNAALENLRRSYENYEALVQGQSGGQPRLVDSTNLSRPKEDDLEKPWQRPTGTDKDLRDGRNGIRDERREPSTDQPPPISRWRSWTKPLVSRVLGWFVRRTE